jgi:hypothetical protein
MVENDINDSIGIVKKPNKFRLTSVHETPWLQGCKLSGIIPEYRRL